MVKGLGISVVCLGFFPFFTGEMLLETSTATNLLQATQREEEEEEEES